MLGLVKKITRTLALTVASLTLATSLVAAQDTLTLESIQQAGVVRVGILVDFPPFGIMNEQNQPDGLDIDVAKALGEKMGVEVELVPVTGPNRIPYLQTGRIDMVIASLAITKERSEQVLFSNPYSAIQTVLYADKALEIADYDDLAGLSIGVARSSPQDVVITAQAPAETHIQRFDEVSAVYQAVLARQLQGAAIGTLIALELDKEMAASYESKFVLYQQVQGVAMRLGSEELAAAMNGYIAEMLGNGELNAINQKWLGTDIPELTSDL